MTGKSPIREARRRSEFLEQAGLQEPLENTELMSKLNGLFAEAVEIEVEAVMTPTVLGDLVWEFSEEQVTAFLPIMGDDYSGLEFPRE